MHDDDFVLRWRQANIMAHLMWLEAFRPLLWWYDINKKVAELRAEDAEIERKMMRPQ